MAAELEALEAEKIAAQEAAAQALLISKRRTMKKAALMEQLELKPLQQKRQNKLLKMLNLQVTIWILWLRL